MAPLTSYLLISWALLAVCCWLPSAARPLQELQEQPCPTVNKKCSSSSFTLLQDIRSLVHNSSLFHGVLCPDREVEVNTETETASACAPILAQSSSCTSTNTPTSFNESKCRVNMERDLAHYSSVLRSYRQYLQRSYHTQSSRTNPAMAEAALSLTIGKIDEMLQSCFLNSTHMDEVRESDSQKWTTTSFHNRKRLCEVTKGFYVRAITINRALGYISSGEHKR